MTLRRASRIAFALLGISCGGGTTGPSTPPTTTTPNGTIVNGCPSLVDPIAARGDTIGGDTYQTFARPFFTTWCVRCHSVTLATPARSGAPEEFNWDVEASVRANLGRIRTQVGVLNSMPLTPPLPSCDERRRLTRWIDAGAP